MKKYLFFLFVCVSCTNSDKLFELVPPNQTGINFENTVTNKEDFNIFSYRNFYNGGGVAVGDINNDGLPDVFFTANMGSNKLYLNKGNFVFEDITQKAGIAELDKWNTGVVMVDLNNDGLLDIYVCNAGYRKFTKNQKNALFINNGNLTFTESAAKYGLDEGGYTTHAAFFDYDLDGDLDCYILNNSFVPVNTLDLSNDRDTPAKDWAVKDFLKGGGDKLLRNDNGFFKDVTQESGIYSSLIGFGLGVTVGDVNNDNYPDIYVSNDFYEKDYLYINQKNGKFKEEIEQRMRHISLASMGADMADINNDGYPEIITTDMLPRSEYRLKTTTSFDNHYIFKLKKEKGFYNQYQQNSLQLNNQDGTFSEIANYAGVSASDWSWGALLFDADNDGFNDIYVSNGIYHDVIDQDFIDFFADDLMKQQAAGVRKSPNTIIKKMPSVPILNNFFHNTKKLKFEEKSQNFGFDTPSFSNGAMYADLDNDGDLDLLVNNVNMPCFVYRNNTDKIKENKPHYLKVVLKGEKNNLFAVGAKVELYHASGVLLRSIAPSRGFQSSTEYPLIFGLGQINEIDSLVITWANQKVSILKKPALDQTLKINFEQAKFTILPKKIPEKSFFTLQNSSFDKHQENEYEDFYKEKNLPVSLSKEGPKAAVGDVNGDGLDDIFIGGAKDQAGQLYLQKGADFQKMNAKIFTEDAHFEDTAITFLDIDKDGDLDLFVGSGGNEYPVGSPELQNRIYENDGKGNFSRKIFPQTMMTNTAVAVAHDFDNDGDMDLFVGSRSQAMEYGNSPQSIVYQNDGKGNFKNSTAIIAPQLLNLGMVREAAWADIDGDKKKELIIVGDWMAPMILSYKKNKFELLQTGLEDFTGFWGALKLVDIDNDGDEDLILGNMGENFNLHSPQDLPLKLWVGDLDNNGTNDKILSKTYNQKDIPVFLKREFAEQFPAKKKDILKHSEYAKKSIQDLFSANILKSITQKKITTFQSAIAFNDGKGKFTLQALPALAQLSCVSAIEVCDVNKDGLKDVFLGGNFSNFIPQLGAVDASRGALLLNKGKGQMEVQTHQKSGFVTEGEIRQIIPFKSQKNTQYLILKNNSKGVVMRNLGE